MNIVKVNTGTQYDVVIDKDVLSNIGDLTRNINKQNYKKIAVITDSNVDKLYGETVIKSYKNNGYEVLYYVFPSGESSKNINCAMGIISWLADNGLTRSDAVVALGGGVCGDLAGFVASIYLRGIDFIQIPTTFLATIDSSVGGKTGVNIAQGKNLVGAFWQPRLVLCDTQTLKTLSHEEFNNGISEAVKYGCIWNEKLFEVIASADLYNDEITDIIAKCVEIKAKVVSEDEKEAGLRAILNFGHTIGHAVEKLSNFDIHHGYGVGIGMYAIAKIGEQNGFTKAGTSERIKKALYKYNIPLTSNYTANEIAKACYNDKKRTADYVKFITIPEIGKYSEIKVNIDNLESFVEGGLS